MGLFPLIITIGFYLGIFFGTMFFLLFVINPVNPDSLQSM